jgi:hypothetical protein
MPDPRQPDEDLQQVVEARRSEVLDLTRAHDELVRGLDAEQVGASHC